MPYVYNRKKALSNEALNPGKVMTPAKPAAALPDPKTLPKSQVDFTQPAQNFTPAKLPTSSANLPPSGKNYTPVPAAQLPTSNMNNVTPSAAGVIPPPAATGTYTAATPQESFAMTPLGETIANVKAGLNFDNPTGQQLESQPPAYITAALLSYATTMASLASLASTANAWTAAGAAAAQNLATQRALAAYAAKQAADVKNLKYLKTVADAAKIKDIGFTIGGSSGVLAMNPTTVAGLNSLLVKSGFTLAAIAIIKDGYESYTFSGFQIAEAMDKLAYAEADARKAGRQDLVNDIQILRDEILNPTGWEAVANSLPWLTAQRATLENINAAKASTKVYEQLQNDIQTQIDTGETEEQKWARVRQQQMDQAKQITDYYNEQRKQMLIWEQQAKDEQRQKDSAYYESQEDKRSRNKDAELQGTADFYKSQYEKQSQYEAEDRQATADFWLAYRKKAQQIADNNRPSKLKFGLIK